MKTPNFEMPPEMRALAEKNLEVARKAFDGYMAAAEQVLSAFEGTAGNAGARELSRKAMDFTQENMAASLLLMQKLARARDPEEVLRLQTEFATAQMERLAEQSRSLATSATRAGGMKGG